MSQEQWSTDLRTRKAERRVGGVSGVDARLAAAAQARPEPDEPDEGGFDRGDLAESPLDSPEARATRLAEMRHQALREQVAAQEAEERELTEEEAAEGAEQTEQLQAAAQAEKQKVDPVLQMAQDRLRNILWGLAWSLWPILVLDVGYTLRWLFPTSWPFNKLPKPAVWEKLALMVLTTLLFLLVLVALIDLMMPAIIAGGAVNAVISAVGL